MISGLQKSTKITIIACASFLAVTALVLLFLMLFPIEPEETPTLQINQPQQTVMTEESTETQLSEDEGLYTEGPHTLSTWSASIEGHTRSTDEYFEYIRSTYEPQETMWHQYITEPEAVMTVRTDAENITPSENGTGEENETTALWETGSSDMESSDYIHTGSETVTETVLPAESSENVPPQSEQLPTDPLPTDPPATASPQTDPPVVNVPAESEENPAG